MSRLGRLTASVALAAALAAPFVAAQAGDNGCAAPPELTGIETGLAHLGARLDRNGPLTIVAVGSSSTQGVGATTPDLSYPSRLEAELRLRFPNWTIRVINRGKGGEDVAEESARLDRDVLAEHPDLVIWQVGTNAVLRRDDLSVDNELIERGVGKLKQQGSDVVLMDLQYAPRVLARPAYVEMEKIIANVAKQARIGMFHRFDIMQHWAATQPAGAPQMIGPDGLHMTDRGYGCLAAELADALVANWATHDPAAQRTRDPLVAGVIGVRRVVNSGSSPAP